MTFKKYTLNILPRKWIDCGSVRGGRRAKREYERMWCSELRRATHTCSLTACLGPGGCEKVGSVLLTCSFCL